MKLAVRQVQHVVNAVLEEEKLAVFKFEIEQEIDAELKGLLVYHQELDKDAHPEQEANVSKRRKIQTEALTGLLTVGHDQGKKIMTNNINFNILLKPAFYRK